MSVSVMQHVSAAAGKLHMLQKSEMSSTGDFYRHPLSSNSSSSSELTNSIKRPNKSVENNIAKKIKLTEKNHYNDKHDVFNSTSTNHSKEDNVVATSTKINKDNMEDSQTNSVCLKHTVAPNCDDSFLKRNAVKSPTPSTSIMATMRDNDETISSNNSDVPVLSGICQNDTETFVNSDDNKTVNSNSSVLNRSLSSDNLVIGENSENTESISADGATTSVHTNTGDANGNNTVEVTGNNDDVLEVSDSDSDLSLDDNVTFNSDYVDKILKGTKDLTETKFPRLLKIFDSATGVSFDQFQSVVIQNILANIMAHNAGRNLDRKFFESYISNQAEMKNLVKYLMLKVKELTIIVNKHKEDIKKNPFAKPHKITRTVGLQATPPKRDVSARLTKIAPQLEKNVNCLNCIISDDDDIEITSLTNQQPSCSKTIDKTEDTTTSIQPSTSPSKTTTEEVVSTAQPKINICIDLTEDIGDGDVPVPPLSLHNNKVLTKSPTKITSPGLNVNIAVSNGSHTPILPQSLSALPVSSISVACGAPSIVASSSKMVEITSVAPSSDRPVSSISTPANGSVIVKVVKDGSQGTPYTLLPVHPVTYARQIATTQMPKLTPVINQLTNLAPVPPSIPIINHPAPLPKAPNHKNLSTWKRVPPAPILTASIADRSRSSSSLMLSWNLPLNQSIATIVSYQIYAYHEVSSTMPSTELWKRIGDVRALPLPMACTLTQFTRGEKYYFAVRAVDIHSRIGQFSLPKVIVLPSVVP